MQSNFRFKAAEIGVFNTKSADAAVSGFDKGCHIIGLTMGEFSLIDMIKSILDKTGPADLYIATWSAGIKDAHQVKWLADTNLITGLRLLTDHSYVNRQSKYAASITDLFGAENIRTSEMHAKFVIIKNEHYSVTVLSSMNLNANKTCETYTIYENQEICDFYMNFINHHFDNMKDGFERSSSVVSKCVNKYFVENSASCAPTSNKHWSEM